LSSASSSPIDTFLPSTITGGIKSDGPITDIDLYNATVTGGVTIISNAPGFSPFVGGSTIHGSLTVTGVNASPGFPSTVGDPGEPSQGGPVADCPANTIDSSVYLTNDQFFELEANTIGGSVVIKSSTVDIRGNDIGGSVHCTDFVPFADDGAADAALPPNACS
jgi:hypothetical protein